MKPAGPATQGSERYVFDPFVVDVAAHTLTREGRACALEPKAFAVLTALLKRPGEMVGRDELLDGIWGHRHVTPGVLTRAIAQLRSALGDDPQHPRYIQTQHALGYRFVAELQEQAAVVDPPDETAQEPALEVLEAYPPGSGTKAAAGALADQAPASQRPVEQTQAAEHPPPPPASHASPRQWWLASVLLALVLGATWLWSEHFGREPAIAGASIAILPFTSISSDPGDAYFAEGLAVEMHDALAGVEGLTLAAQMSPDDPRLDGDIKALGTALGVASVLKASVRRDGRKIRISAQLSDTATGYSVWNKTYDRELADIFATQAEIATEVAGSLVGILPAQRDALARRLQPTTNLAAFDLYLRGLVALRGASAEDQGAGAIAFFRKALSVDRSFARAQAGICRVEVANFRNRNDAAAFDLAQESCDRARQMDASLGEVSLAMAELHAARGDHAKATEYFFKAESHAATRASAYAGLAMMHADRGQDLEATDYFNRALALQPGNPRIHSQLAYRHYLAGRLPEAIAAYRRAVELQPDDKLVWSYLGGVYLTAGQVPEAERALVRSLSIGPSYSALTNLGEIRYMTGRHSEAVELQQRAIKLAPTYHMTWGHLGRAQLAYAATARQAPESFAQAAEHAQRYIQINADDAKALAALGWYRANLGQPESALELVARSEELGGEPGEVALMNAQTLARVGESAQARERITAARAAGIFEMRISGNAVLRELAAEDHSANQPATMATAQDASDGPTRGERNGD